MNTHIELEKYVHEFININNQRWEAEFTDENLFPTLPTHRLITITPEVESNQESWRVIDKVLSISNFNKEDSNDVKVVIENPAVFLNKKKRISIKNSHFLFIK